MGQPSMAAFLWACMTELSSELVRTVQKKFFIGFMAGTVSTDMTGQIPLLAWSTLRGNSTARHIAAAPTSIMEPSSGSAQAEERRYYTVSLLTPTAQPPMRA